MSKATATRHLSPSARRGTATLWLILFLPVLLILLCIVMEFGSVWLARTELKSGLDSAALAALTYWNPTTQNAANARSTAITVASSNTVLGTPLTLTNANILLGTVPSNLDTPFNNGATPNCALGINTFDLDITVDSPDTLGDRNTFRIRWVNVDQPSYYISKLTIDLRGSGTDDGSFQPGPTVGFTEATGYGPQLGNSPATEVSWNAAPTFSGTGNSVMVMTFNPNDWRAGNVDTTKDLLVFGVDTDRVDDNELGPPPPSAPPLDSDQGGDFGEPPPPAPGIGRIWYTFELSNGTSTLTAVFNGRLQRTGAGADQNKSQFIGNTPPPPPPPVADPAVRATATWLVPSKCIPGFNYSVTAQSTSVSRCSDPTFRLIYSPN